MASVKCAWCSIKDEKTKMQQEGNKKYYHIESCLEEFRNDKIFKQKEREELDMLVDTIVEVHRLKVRSSVPSSFYPFINEVRNDSVLFGKVRRAYKEGISYKLISDTYLYCRDKIAWAKSNKEFKNTMGELRYGLAIVKSNIENAIRDISKKEKQKASTVKLIENIKTMDIVSQRIKEVKSNEHKEVNNDDEVDVESLFD